MPRLFTRMSAAGKSRVNAAQPSAVARSNGAARTRADGTAWRSLSVASCTAASVRPLTTTSAPMPASPIAVASPMPRVDPVTMAVLPLRSRSTRPPYHACSKGANPITGKPHDVEAIGPMSSYAARAIKDLQISRDVFDRALADPASVEAVPRASGLATDALRSGKKILFAGNGGSAADAQHLATELVVRFIVNRAALPAIALTTDTSILTAIGNDLGFDQLFARQIAALGQAGDAFVAIST